MTLNNGIDADVRASLVAHGVDPSRRSVSNALRGTHRVVDQDGLSNLVQRMRSDFSGFGPLDPWLSTAGVTDIVVNGHREAFIDRGRGLEPIEVAFRDDDAIRRLVQRLATSVGRRIDDANPCVDAPLPGGVRLHAILPPLSDRVCVSLRIARSHAFSVDELVVAGTIAPALVTPLHDLMSARLTFLVSGGTGSGKTTLLSTLLGLIEPATRLVIVEDTAELAPRHAHTVRLQTRTANIEGRGAVSMRDLVRQAMRMRPDRLVVGEARGAEMVDLLAALNTGHEGGCGTIHANHPLDVPARVEALTSTAGIGRAAAHSQLVAAIDVVVHLARRPDGCRFVELIAVLERDEDGFVRAVPSFAVDAVGGVHTQQGVARWNQLLQRRR